MAPGDSRRDACRSHGDALAAHRRLPVAADRHGARGVGWLRGVGMLNLEGLTLDRGELSTGGYGEGYVDRRHPHAYVHELLAGAEARVFGVRASVFAGRGFAPFGSDDPMVRPFEKYPVNHHLAQILERVVAVAAVQRGPVIGEVGDVQRRRADVARDVARLSAASATRGRRASRSLPFAGRELSGSVARVTSPEERTGAGLDQHKSSVVARYSRESDIDFGATRWSNGRARTSSIDGDDDHVAEQRCSARARTVRAASSLRRGPSAPTARRRSLWPTPFAPRARRSISRTSASRDGRRSRCRFRVPAARAGVASARPFVEVARIAAAAGNPAGVFNPELRYGADRMWMVSAGVRLAPA